MNYDINEKETSIDNMGDSLLIAIEECVNRGNKGDADAIMSEWIVDGRDPIDGSYEFIFIPNFTLNWWLEESKLCKQFNKLKISNPCWKD